MHRICDTLVEHGYDVTLIGRSKKNSQPLSKFSFKTVRLSLLTERGFLFYLEYNVRLFFHLLVSNGDVFSAVDTDTILAFRLASGLKRKPLVFDAHELFTELPELSNKPMKKRLWNLANKIGLKGKVSCYTVNNEIADILNQNYKKSFEVIHNFPIRDFIKRDSGIPSDPIQLVYVGMINQGRGVEQLIELVAQYNRFELHLIGNGDLYDELKTTTVSNQRIHWYGFKQREEIIQMLPKFDIGTNLLDGESLNYYYSSANKFFDYVNASLPVLTMDFPVYNRLNQSFNVAQLIEDLDINTIKEGIDQLTSNYSHHSEECVKASNNWNWQTEKEKLISIYQKT